MLPSLNTTHPQVGDLRLTSNGVAQTGLIVRHLVMPGLTVDGVNIMRWIAETLSKDTFVNIMDQYRPTFLVGKERKNMASSAASDIADDNNNSQQQGQASVRHSAINRPVSSEEVKVVEDAARAFGLYRFNSDWTN